MNELHGFDEIVQGFLRGGAWAIAMAVVLAFVKLTPVILR